MNLREELQWAPALIAARRIEEFAGVDRLAKLLPVAGPMRSAPPVQGETLVHHTPEE